MTRSEILDEAKRITATDRNQQYGEPEDNFANIAGLWNSYLTMCPHSVTVLRGESFPCIKPHDVAVLMILTKIARLAVSPESADHWIDIAGYAACGGQCAVPTHIETEDGLMHTFEIDPASMYCKRCGQPSNYPTHR